MKESFEEMTRDAKEQLEQYLQEILAPMSETVKWDMYRYLREQAQQHMERFFKYSLERMTAEQRALFFAPGEKGNGQLGFSFGPAA